MHRYKLRVTLFTLLADTTHSKLVEAIPKPWAKAPEFDKVLHEVGTYIDPNSNNLRGNVTQNSPRIFSFFLGSSAMKQGMYTLKPECWSEYEGKCFLFYSNEELQASSTRYQEYLNKNPQSRLFIKPYSLTHKIPLSSSFSKLKSLVNNSLLHSFIYCVLYNAFSKTHA